MILRIQCRDTAEPEVSHQLSTSKFPGLSLKEIPFKNASWILSRKTNLVFGKAWNKTQNWVFMTPKKISERLWMENVENQNGWRGNQRITKFMQGTVKGYYRFKKNKWLIGSLEDKSNLDSIILNCWWKSYRQSTDIQSQSISKWFLCWCSLSLGRKNKAWFSLWFHISSHRAVGQIFLVS